MIEKKEGYRGVEHLIRTTWGVTDNDLTGNCDADCFFVPVLNFGFFRAGCPLECEARSSEFINEWMNGTEKSKY